MRSPQLRGLCLLLSLAVLGGCATGTAGTRAGDVNTPAATYGPTKGELVNSTPWSVQVFVDPDVQHLDRTKPLVLAPGTSLPFEFDREPHRIVAQAREGTTPDARVVGRFDRTIRVERQGAKWSLKFRQTDFR